MIDGENTLLVELVNPADISSGFKERLTDPIPWIISPPEAK